MGVIRKFTYNSVCEDDGSFNLENIANDNRDDLLDIPDIHAEPEAQQIDSDHNLAQELQDRELARQVRNRNRRFREQQKKATVKPEPAFRGLGCRGKSYKKYRRYENANLIGHGNYVGADGDDFLNEISIHDFVPQSVSSFAQLITERENMKIWNDLINMSEDAQQLILDEIDRQEEDKLNNQGKKKRHRSKKNFEKHRTTSTGSSVSEDEKDEKDEKETFNQKRSKGGDKREKHPAFSAQQCFARIDNYLKNLLKKKHIPLTLLESIETEVVDFFSSAPVSVYKSCLSSGFERLLLHATCQYMDLKCQSCNGADGSRWSHVRNPRPTFVPPLINLTSYLATYCQKQK